MRLSYLSAVVLLAAGLPQAGARAQNLTVALASNPSAVDPHFHNLVPNNAIAAHVFDNVECLMVHPPGYPLPGRRAAGTPIGGRRQPFRARMLV